MTTSPYSCPRCGAQNSEDNGGRGADLVLLCVAPVTLGAQDCFGNTREQAIAAGYQDVAAEHVCGMQWNVAERRADLQDEE